MNEYKLIWIVGLGLLSLFLTTILYLVGGRHNKIIRRLGSALVLAGGTNGVALLTQAWHWQYTLLPFTLFGGFILGYGGETAARKTIRRTIYVLGLLVSSVICLWAGGFTSFGIGIIVYQAIIAGGSIWLGVKNPFKNAVLEEGMVCMTNTLFLPFWAMVR